MWKNGRAVVVDVVACMRERARLRGAAAAGRLNGMAAAAALGRAYERASRTNERPTDRRNERFVLAGPGAPGRPERERTATWLILPVVICLSQRLSHACLSTYLDTVKPRMAH